MHRNDIKFKIYLKFMKYMTKTNALIIIMIFDNQIEFEGREQHTKRLKVQFV